MQEIKPCPFCGGEVAIAEAETDRFRHIFFVTRGLDDMTRCKCRVYMESEPFDPERAGQVDWAKKNLVVDWNRRVNDEGD